MFLYNLLDLKRTAWEGPELEAGKHTIVFDFKFDGGGFGKGGTGVLIVEGKEVDKKSMENTPIMFRGLRHRAGHPHPRGAHRVSLRLPIQIHWQDQQANLRPRPAQVHRSFNRSWSSRQLFAPWLAPPCGSWLPLARRCARAHQDDSSTYWQGHRRPCPHMFLPFGAMLRTRLIRLRKLLVAGGGGLG